MTVIGGGDRSCTCLALITDYSTVVFLRATKLAGAGSEARNRFIRLWYTAWG